MGGVDFLTVYKLADLTIYSAHLHQIIKYNVHSGYSCACTMYIVHFDKIMVVPNEQARNKDDLVNIRCYTSENVVQFF